VCVCVCVCVCVRSCVREGVCECVDVPVFHDARRVPCALLASVGLPPAHYSLSRSYMHRAQCNKLGRCPS